MEVTAPERPSRYFTMSSSLWDRVVQWFDEHYRSQQECEKLAHLPSDLLLLSTSFIQLSWKLKQLLTHASAIKEYVLSITNSSWKRLLHTCRNEKANKAPRGFKPINLRSICGFFPPPAQRVLCVPPGKLQFLLSQPTQKRNAKIALISPKVWDSSASA